MKRLFLSFVLLLSVSLIPSLVQGGTSGPARSQLRSGPPAQQRTNQVKEPKPDAELKSIVGMAAGVPAEFGADVLIRLAQSNKITQRSLKIELLTRAFYLAESAQQPVRLAALAGTSVDTRSGYLDMAFDLALDTLSLQSRAIGAMVPLDPQNARKLFSEIRLPDLRLLSCDDALVYDLTSFYQTLTNLMNSGFTPKEKAEGVDLAFLEPYVQGILFHAQAGPFAKLLDDMRAQAGQRREMADLFAGALGRVRGDARSFTAVVTIYKFDLLPPVTDLMTKLEATENFSPALLQELRAYLVANSQGERCADLFFGGRDPKSLPQPVQHFNEWLARSSHAQEIAPIDTDELKGAQIMPRPKYHQYWQSPAAKSLLTGIQNLRWEDSDRNAQFSADERKSFAWASQLTDFLKQLESWSAEDEDSPADFFHQKCVLYEGLVELVPEKSQRVKIIDSFVRFLELNAFQTESRIEWFLHVERLFSRAATASDEALTEVTQALLRSRDPALSLSARLERWAPQHLHSASQ
jgi:hypothetical protein